MTRAKREAGFTVVDALTAVTIIAALSVIYFLLVGSYREHRLSEQAAKALRQATQAQEDYFTKENRYFDAEVSGNGDEVYLVTPDGKKTDVRIPANVYLSLKAKGKSKTMYVGQAFSVGSKVLHRYDSRTGKMNTVKRAQDETS